MKVDEEGYNFIINSLFIVGIYLTGVLFIVGKDRGLISILVGTVLIFLELYWSHRILHLITPDSVLHWYNPHIPVHHAKVKPLSLNHRNIGARIACAPHEEEVASVPLVRRAADETHVCTSRLPK